MGNSCCCSGDADDDNKSLIESDNDDVIGSDDVDGNGEHETENGGSDGNSGKKCKAKKKEKKSKKTKGDKEKEEVVKLEIKSTKVETVDKSFKDAADPFNLMVDTQTAFQKTIADFKSLANHEKTDTLKETVLDLKKKFPQLKLQLKTSPVQLVLTTGESDDKGEDVVKLGKKLIDFIKDINDMAKRMLDLLPKAQKDAEDLLKKSSELLDAVKNAKLKWHEVPGALKNAQHNVKEFKKVPNIGENIYKVIDNFLSDCKKTVEALESTDVPTGVKGQIEDENKDSTSPPKSNCEGDVTEGQLHSEADEDPSGDVTDGDHDVTDGEHGRESENADNTSDNAALVYTDK